MQTTLSLKKMQTHLSLVLVALAALALAVLALWRRRHREGWRQQRARRTIFWTGGYDSTFCVLHALLVEGATVVPVYLSGVIDNAPSSRVRRRNQSQELSAMADIRRALQRRYPRAARRLRPVVSQRDVAITAEVREGMADLHRRRMVRRPVCQYGALAQAAIDRHRVELAVEHEPRSSMLYRAVHRHVVTPGGRPEQRRIAEESMRRIPALRIFRGFRFPTLHLSKADMLATARRHGFDDLLLKHTWSCWYPVDGRPCGRCVMCHDRRSIHHSPAK